MADLPDDAPRPRLCHITKWADFDGYGFNLHADKSRPGQYIGKVDKESPADVALLKEGDRIIEVNGVNISNENHKQVVQRIKAVLDDTRLLVVDAECDRWYKSRNQVVSSSQENILTGTSKRDASSDAIVPAQNGTFYNGDTRDNTSVTSETSSVRTETSSQPNGVASDREESQTSEVSTTKVPEEEKDSLSSTNAECTEIPDPDPILEYENVRFESEVPPAPKDTIICPNMDPIIEKDPTMDPIVEKDSTMDPIIQTDPIVDPVVSSNCSQNGSDISEADNEADNNATRDSDGDKGIEMSSLEYELKTPMSLTPSPPPSIEPENNDQNGSIGKISPQPNKNMGGLNLNMTAAEMRAHLATKKKFDPRNNSIDLKKKYQIIKNM